MNNNQQQRQQQGAVESDAVGLAAGNANNGSSVGGSDAGINYISSSSRSTGDCSSIDGGNSGSGCVDGCDNSDCSTAGDSGSIGIGDNGAAGGGDRSTVGGMRLGDDSGKTGISCVRDTTFNLACTAGMAALRAFRKWWSSDASNISRYKVPQSHASPLPPPQPPPLDYACAMTGAVAIKQKRRQHWWQQQRRQRQ